MGTKTPTAQDPPQGGAGKEPLEELWQGHYGDSDGSPVLTTCVVAEIVEEVLLGEDLL